MHEMKRAILTLALTVLIGSLSPAHASKLPQSSAAAARINSDTSESARETVSAGARLHASVKAGDEAVSRARILAKIKSNLQAEIKARNLAAATAARTNAAIIAAMRSRPSGQTGPLSARLETRHIDEDHRQMSPQPRAPKADSRHR
jgi:hypothetical protein